MNWRDVPLQEHEIKSWSSEHNAQRQYDCDFCGHQLWGRYYRTVWASARNVFVRRFHVDCA